ncbi:hypothetical protein V7128_16895 [Neobacillus vireti]|uniref:hypothetical protein n=1 Tax=Neobacillus vireti TaxID=220686 RepID=UPI002FFEBAF6
MNFKQAIDAFKSSGDRTIINYIMAAVENDFMSDRTRDRVKDGTASGGIRIELEHDYEYVSYSIRAMRELLMRHVEMEYDEEIPELDNFQRLLSRIDYDFDIEFNGEIYGGNGDRISYYKITPELFADLEKHMDEIEEWFPDYEYRYFMRLFARFKAVEESRRAEVTNRKQELEESAVKALEYALKYVDISKSEKEIVKYINLTFKSKLADDEIKRNGMRRIQRQAGIKRQSYVVKPYFPEDSDYAIIGRSINLSVLTKGQREFIRDVSAIIEEDKKAGDTSNYSCDIDGEVIISRKYIAEKLGIREDLVRKKLERIKKKL